MTEIPIQSIYGASYPRSRAVLLVNLGSPDSPNVEDVATYLKTFLMDEHVIGLSYFWRSLLVKGLISPSRAPRSAKTYATIWDTQTRTFPLIRHTATLARGLADCLEMPVALAMRYGKPEMRDALLGLMSLERIREVIVVPLYPHYTRSTFLTAQEYVERMAAELGASFCLKAIAPFYSHTSYRQVLAQSIRPYLEGGFDRLIVSFHGIPLSHLDEACAAHNGSAHHCYDRIEAHGPDQRSTCYRLHCESTVAFLAQDLGLEDNQIELAYQSRLGWHPWLKPYMKQRVPHWPLEGAKRVAVVCPGFVCDCLETLYEIDREYREAFMAAGGTSFTYVPCLNSSSDFVEVLAKLVLETSPPPSDRSIEMHHPKPHTDE